VSQFTMFDNKDLEQCVHIKWSRVLEHDSASGAPDEMQDGYWPSQDPNDAGWVPPEKFDNAQQSAQERMDAWKGEEWWYVGVRARADILVPVGGDSFHILTLLSAGCWGIESDAGDYLNEVYRKEKKSLLREIQILTTAFMGGKCEMEDTNE